MSDLIDRKTVFDVIDKCILEKPEGDTVEIRELLKLITKIYRMPSAQPQRKTGKWIDDCTCSVCNWTHEDSNGFALLTHYNYCPHCGADMRGEQDG